MAQAIIDPVKNFYRNRIIIASIITVSFLVVAIFAVKNGLGVGNKKAWDWLDVLVFPVVLAVGALWYEKTEQERDRIHAVRQRRREELAVEKHTQAAALETYLDQISHLMVEKNLRRSPPDSDIRALAQARTLTILLALGPERKRHPLKLIAQMRLIDKENCIIELPHADLVEADLHEVTLVRVNLTDVDLRSANLTGANLEGTVLADADLRDADLRGANLTGTDLTRADLRGARYDAETSWPEGFELETSGAVLVPN